jgi:hypothetical protein
MSYKPLQLYYKLFTATGAATNADSLPVATANHDGADDSAFVLTVTSVDTGRYKITGTVPSGYAEGDIVNVMVAATMSGVAGKAIVDTFTIDTKYVGDLHDAITAPTTSQIAAALLVTPANKLATDSSGDVTFNNTITAPTTSQIAAAILNSPSNKLLTDSSGFVSTNNGGSLSLASGVIQAGTTSTSFVMQGSSLGTTAGLYKGRRFYVTLAAGGYLMTDECITHSYSSPNPTMTFTLAQNATPAVADTVSVVGV